jgi:hypothetical protein
MLFPSTKTSLKRRPQELCLLRMTPPPVTFLTLWQQTVLCGHYISIDIETHWSAHRHRD